MLRSVYLILLVFLLSVSVGLAQSGKTCLITDLIHWGVEHEVSDGIPDYFSSDSLWVEEIKEHIRILVEEKFGATDVKFLNPGIQIKNGHEEIHWGTNLDSIDRAKADLFVSVSSSASSIFEVQEMVVEVEVENKDEKKVYRQKSKLLVRPQSGSTGIETNIDIGQADYKMFFHDLLEAAFVADKKNRKLGYRDTKRIQTNDYDDFLAKADQCNISRSTENTWTEEIDFLGKRENVAIEVRGKNERVNDADRITNDQKEYKGLKLITSKLLPEPWTVKYKLVEKKGILRLSWEQIRFSADVLSEDKMLLGQVSHFDYDSLSASLGDDTFSLNWVYHNSIIEIYRNQELSGLAQIPKGDRVPFVKFFFLRELEDHQVGRLLSLFLLNRAFRQL